MNGSIEKSATNPSQYDLGQVLWSQEGRGLTPIRRLFFERLYPHLGSLAGQNVLDLGCGQGWLTDELARRGANVTGIDPSTKNIQSAIRQYPDVRFEFGHLQTYESLGKFSLITAVMVFEHLPSLPDSFARLRELLARQGRLLIITGDFDIFTRPRHGYTVETEYIAPGEVATRTDYGDRAGVIHDIFREPDRFTDAAQASGFRLQAHEPIPAPPWLVAEQPMYAVHNNGPLFHLLEFQLEQ